MSVELWVVDYRESWSGREVETFFLQGILLWWTFEHPFESVHLAAGSFPQLTAEPSPVTAHTQHNYQAKQSKLICADLINVGLEGNFQWPMTFNNQGA